MRYYNTLIETIGDTPLVKLNSVNKGIKGTILVKVEYFNPGNSVKDRIALKMIEDAEKSPNHGTYSDFALGFLYNLLFPVLDWSIA